MSESGYWKYKGAQQKFEADKHTKQIEMILSRHGWIKQRDSTPREDRFEKWDAHWLNTYATDELVDYKTGIGVQDSHKKLWDKGELKVTTYAMYDKRHRNKLKLVSAKAFWGSNPTRHVNKHGQSYWVKGDGLHQD